MTFTELEHFLRHKMRMSHIYQPVMIKCLLKHNGVAPDVTIAKELLKYDPSHLEYYQDVTNNMVGRVLRGHKVVQKDKNHYTLTAFERLTQEQIAALIVLCNQKLEEYITKRGEAIWQHRKRNRGYITGSIRYEVLKRANFGVSFAACTSRKRL